MRETGTGSIVKDKSADMIFLFQNLFLKTVTGIHETLVQQTIFKGETA